MNFSIFNIFEVGYSFLKKRKLNVLLIFVLVFSNFILLYIGLDNHGLTIENPTKIEGDSHDYINSCEKLIKGQGFTFYHISDDDQFVSNFPLQKSQDKAIFYSFRTPGFSFFYLPMRIFLNKENSILFFILFQTILNALAKFCIVRLIYEFTKNKFLAALAFISLCSIPYFSQYNNILLTDSLGLSFILFAFFYLYNAIKQDYNKWLILFSGLCFTFAVFLRPFLILTLIFAIILLLYLLLKKYSLRKTLFMLLYFGSSFILIDSLWVVRNYYYTDSFIPLASTMHFQDHKHTSFKEIKKLSGNLGYSINWWDTTSPVSWFLNIKDLRKLSEVIDKPVLSNNQMIDILISRDLLAKSLDTTRTIKQRRFYERISELLLKRINYDLEENHFYQSQISARINILLNFITQPIPRDYRDITPEYRGKIIFMNHLIVNFTIWGGLIFLIGTWFMKVDYLFKFLSASTLSIILFFTLIHNSYEYRELYTLTGFLMIGAFMLLQLIETKPLFIKLFVISIIILVIIGSYYQTIPEL